MIKIFNYFCVQSVNVLCIRAPTASCERARLRNQDLILILMYSCLDTNISFFLLLNFFLMLTRLTNQGRSNYQKSTLYIAELVGGWVGRAREKAIQGCDWFTGSDVFTPSAAPALYWLLLPCVQKELAHVVQLSVFTTF